MKAGEWIAQFSPAYGWQIAEHTAGCDEAPPGTCSNVPDFLHHIELRTFQFPLGVTVGLGRGFALTLGDTFLAFRRNVRYETLGGAPYTQSFPEVHHPNKTLAGLGDGQAALRWDGRFGERSMAGISLFTSLPIGRTGENVLRPGVYNRLHEHIQFGTGAFVPGVELSLNLAPRPWGATVWLRRTVPYYDSPRNGFRPAPFSAMSAGPIRQLSRESQMSLQIEWTSFGTESWNGAPNDEAVSKDALAVVARYDLAATDRWRWSLQGQFEFWNRLGQPSPGPYDQRARLRQPFVVSTSIAFGP